MEKMNKSDEKKRFKKPHRSSTSTHRVQKTKQK
jgi:hypothetical protein